MITVFESSKTLFGALLHRFQFALSDLDKKNSVGNRLSLLASDLSQYSVFDTTGTALVEQVIL